MGGHLLVDGAVALSRKFHIPEIVIGLTIVACGTSAPEIAVSLSSVIGGSPDVGVGNVLGSNIVNILFIIGVCCLIRDLYVKKNTVLYEVPFLGFISVLLMFMGWQYGVITRGCALVLCVLFGLFCVYLFKVSKNDKPEFQANIEMSKLKIFMYILLGIVALVFGANLTVNSATDIAHLLHVSERIIGLTVVAFGTSLPELVTCVTAVLKKRPGIVIGNAVGSNLFNILFVLGVTGLVQPIPFERAFLVDAAFGVVATVMLWLFIVNDKKLNKSNGLALLSVYVFYIIYLMR